MRLSAESPDPSPSPARARRLWQAWLWATLGLYLVFYLHGAGSRTLRRLVELLF